jgi:hypothetical protein
MVRVKWPKGRWGIHSGVVSELNRTGLVDSPQRKKIGVKFEPEFRDRAVRLYLERRAGHQEESLAALVRQVGRSSGKERSS